MTVTDSRSLERHTRLILFIFLLVAISLYCRGPINALKDSRDFAIIYLSSSSWVQGADPYDQELYYANWVKAGALPDKMPDKYLVPSVYPIFLLPLITPLTFLPWPVAKIAWTVLNSLAFFGMLTLLLIMSNLNLGDWRAITLVSTCMILYPIHVTMAMGQPILLAMVSGLGSILAANSKRPVFSAMLLAASLCLKPQLGIAFFGYLLFIRQWKITGLCLITVMVIFLVGILRLGLDNLSWIHSWTTNLGTAFAEGGINDPTMNNPYRHHLLNLQFPLSMMIHSENIVKILTILIVVLELLFFMQCVKIHDNFDALLALSILAIVSLFPIYHRYYDAAILMFALTIIFVLINSKYNRFCLILLGLTIPFLLPFQDIIVSASNHDIINYSNTKSCWWNILVLPLQVYCLFIMSIVLLGIFKIKNSTCE